MIHYHGWDSPSPAQVSHQTLRTEMKMHFCHLHFLGWTMEPAFGLKLGATGPAMLHLQKKKERFISSHEALKWHHTEKIEPHVVYSSINSTWTIRTRWMAVKLSRELWVWRSPHLKGFVEHHVGWVRFGPFRAEQRQGRRFQAGWGEPQPPRRVQSGWRSPGGVEQVTDTVQSRV